MGRTSSTERIVMKPSSGTRLAGVEGLRALAATAIVLVHVWGFSTPHGPPPGAREWIGDALSTLSAGVTLFFTLSGFLLYRPFAAAIARGVSHMPIRAYLRNRVLRIAPAYWVIFAVTALLLGAAAVRGAHGTQTGRLGDPLSVIQAGLLLQDYHPKTMVIGIGPAWSLAVEVVFYCTLPLLVLAAAPRGDPALAATGFLCSLSRRSCSSWSVCQARPSRRTYCRERRQAALASTGIP
jgi:peptidoglycan/LPS O-acetylase OafA/YrhL